MTLTYLHAIAGPRTLHTVQLLPLNRLRPALPPRPSAYFVTYWSFNSTALPGLQLYKIRITSPPSHTIPYRPLVRDVCTPCIVFVRFRSLPLTAAYYSYIVSLTPVCVLCLAPSWLPGPRGLSLSLCPCSCPPAPVTPLGAFVLHLHAVLLACRHICTGPYLCMPLQSAHPSG
ncbi:hypothetical protein L227DRAFT_68364 [Lentinus tigrinus ALCF2SS1-6]|uniref:Uncharacterized protein n=1 Tax=Lentinus tigrinus ALCF2SS1-6 TaxID=1328759 RepID=A0A5C2SJ17_9APHY|nr:hypothetical protein L227DRAFT_68364 [Lentinus tigrinus ALCF2SS1-6]